MTIWAITQTAAYLAGVVLGLLPTIEPSDLSTVMPYAFTFILPLLFTAVFLILRKRRRIIHNSNYPIAPLKQMVPAIVMAKHTAIIYDVRWDVVIGSQGFYEGDEYPFVKGPFCPADHYQLDSVNEPTIFGSCRAVWRCGYCGARYPRPKDQFCNEASTAGKIVLAEYQAAEEADQSDEDSLSKGEGRLMGSRRRRWSPTVRR